MTLHIIYIQNKIYANRTISFTNLKRTTEIQLIKKLLSTRKINLISYYTDTDNENNSELTLTISQILIMQ